jgi:histidyl-tRNA synthetase
MADKSSKFKARLPRGLSDRGPAEIAATRRMIEQIRQVYELYGFDPVETPAIEFTDALGKFLPDQDRPNEGVFSFQDDDEQWLSLRYDLTAPLARYVAENFQNLPLPYRSYRFGWVFRNEKPGPGRYRQFMQFDADTVGAASIVADAEICMMAADTMEALGIPHGSYVVKVNNRKILEGIRDAVSVTSDAQWLTALRAIDVYDRLGIEGVRARLGKERIDSSGDVTKGAGLNDEQIRLIENILFGKLTTGQRWDQNLLSSSRPSSDMLRRNDGRFYDNLEFAKQLFDSFAYDSVGQHGAQELAEIIRLVEAAGYGSSRIRIDTSVVRGLEYYTGPVYEVELTLETKDEKGRPVRFGSVGGGGRYDGLVSRFRGEPVPATGFSIGVSRLQAALTMLGKLDTKPAPGPVLVTVFDRERVADYEKMVATLRAANIRAELYLGNPKHSVGQQLKYADRRSSPCAIIQGSDEIKDPKNPKVLIKDLIVGAELAKLEKGREEHLKKQVEAQREVPVAQLVDAVRAVLTRHGVKWD